MVVALIYFACCANHRGEMGEAYTCARQAPNTDLRPANEYSLPPLKLVSKCHVHVCTYGKSTTDMQYWTSRHGPSLSLSLPSHRQRMYPSHSKVSTARVQGLNYMPVCMHSAGHYIMKAIDLYVRGPLHTSSMYFRHKL